MYTNNGPDIIYSTSYHPSYTEVYEKPNVFYDEDLLEEEESGLPEAYEEIISTLKHPYQKKRLHIHQKYIN